MQLPDTLLKNLRDHQENADAWLVALPEYLRRLESRWHIRTTGLVEDLSFNVVMFAEGDNAEAYILKLSPPGEDIFREVAALELYNGDGINRLVKVDTEGTALLLERLNPGVSFWRSDDYELTTRTCAELLLKLWRPVEDVTKFRSLASWTRAIPDYLKTYPDGGGFLPHALVDKANSLRAELLDESDTTLLHADLHHGNILSASRAPYLAIDPKGIVGNKGFDVTAFLRNPLGISKYPGFEVTLKRRISIFSEMLGLSEQEIASWSIIQTVLDSCWAKGKGDHAETERVVRILERFT